MTYTDEEIQQALEFFEHKNAMNGSVVNPLIWASSEYLKAKEVLEWYEDENNYSCEYGEDSEGYWHENSPANIDEGQRAREFLKRTKGE